jgi:2-succinyl-6-hydroxy-2,4-cyclohexadiene-1-carboxylate synthase
MPFAAVNSARYYYEISGNGEPLILLHGFTGSSEIWARHVAILAERYQTMTIDLLGHGQTDSPATADRYSLDSCARDVIDLVEDHFTGPVNLLGYSMGGRLALNMAITRSSLVNALILESASPGLNSSAERQERIRADERLAWSIEQDGVAVFIDKWEQIPLFASQDELTEPVRARLRRQRLKNNPHGLANSLRGMGTGAQRSLWSYLPGLVPPLLLIVGELDRKYVELGRQMAELAPNAQVEVVPAVGHAVHLERPQQFNRTVMRFLEKMGQRTV